MRLLVHCRVLILATVLTACAPVEVTAPGRVASPVLSQAQVVKLLPETAPPLAKPRWAQAILHAFRQHQLAPTETNVCAVVAVIDQESNFSANPRVPGLGNLVLQALYRETAARSHARAADLLFYLLKHRPTVQDNFYQRIQRAQTEKDLDLVYRDMVRYLRQHYPVSMVESLANWLVGQAVVERFHPIKTAGCMQVSVAYAATMAGCSATDDACWQRVRDDLYTLEGGVYYGVARLLGYPAGYDSPLFRFADFNVGPYASRNAAFQQQVARLSQQAPALDGDLLAYDAQGKPNAAASQTELAIRRVAERFGLPLAHDTIHHDLLAEKELGFESSATYRQVVALFTDQYRTPPYAQLPQVTLKSPKLSRPRTTEWFAKAVMNRYTTCLSK